MSAFARTLFFEETQETSAYYRRSHGQSSLIAYKAMMKRTGKYLDIKVGIVGSGSRATQAAQGAVSFAVPGDLSEVRNPVRAGIYSALTPGGGSRLRIPGGAVKPTRGYRCQEGFQFGGRFTDSRYSTCGQMLFDLFALGQTIGATGTIAKPKTPQALNPATSVTPVTPGNIQGAGQIISRAAQIPRVGALDNSKLKTNIEKVTTQLSTYPNGSAVMVRRDGFMLRPVVTAAVLRTVPDNRNMEGATYLTAISQASSLGGEELGLLSNTGVNKLQYVLPSGVVLTLEKKRPLTVGERRKLGRTVNEVASIDVSQDPTARLKAVAEQSGGGISYSENLDVIPKANELISVGKGKTTRRWIAESFKKQSVLKASVDKQNITEDETKLSDKIQSISAAVKHLDENGDPSSIDPEILAQAMSKTKAFKTTKLPDGSLLHERADGKSFFEVSSIGQFEHLGARVASDVQTQLDLKSPAVTFIGSGTRRRYMIEHPRNKVPENSLSSASSIDKVKPNDLVAIAVSDWLVDERNRTPGNIVPFKTNAGDGAMAASSQTSGLADLSKAQMSNRQKLKLDEYFNELSKNIYSNPNSKLNASQQRLIVNQLDKIIERAIAFNWEEYISRLSLDGKLSAAEKAHLEVIRSLYSNRLENLKQSKTVFLKFVGAA